MTYDCLCVVQAVHIFRDTMFRQNEGMTRDTLNELYAGFVKLFSGEILVWGGAELELIRG